MQNRCLKSIPAIRIGVSEQEKRLSRFRRGGVPPPVFRENTAKTITLHNNPDEEKRSRNRRSSPRELYLRTAWGENGDSFCMENRKVFLP